MKLYKVIIIDDEPIIRTSLESWLSPKFKVCSFDSAQSFLKAYEDFELEDGLASCILLDFQMPEMNGVELQKCLRVMNTDFPIIFMSGNVQQSDIIDAWRGGAVDFILKPFTPQQLTDTLEKQFKAIKQAESIQSLPVTKPIQIQITKREAEVLLLLGNGHQQHEVAERLGISIRTVKMYRTFLKNKLDLNTLGELIKYCQQYKSLIQKIADGPNETNSQQRF
jgi:FixJ family two-component response regulator